MSAASASPPGLSPSPSGAPVATSSTQAVLAGVVVALVGFGGAFAVVLAGLRSVGASPDQAASGLLVLSVAMGLVGVGLGLRHRMPISIAWSTPGAALLVTNGHVHGGYPAALGAFVVCGVLIVLCGLWARLSGWLSAIPVALANAMLAGVLFGVCLAPVRALVAHPATAAPGIAVWVLMSRVQRRWAVPAAFAATAIAVALHPLHHHGPAPGALPRLTLTAPTLTLSALVSVAVPLFIVTMASQNIPGMSVLASFGYRPPLRPILVSTGLATAACAPFGGHALNLAAITAGLAAGPDAHPDPARRWITSVTAGGMYVGLGLCAGLAAVLLAAAPLVVIESVAGLALLGTLGAALTAAQSSPGHREAATVTFVVSASAITVWGIGAPFWGLVAGLVLLGVQARRGGGGVGEPVADGVS